MNITANWKFKMTSKVWRLVLDLLYENCDGPTRILAQNVAVSSNASISEDIVLLSVNYTDTWWCWMFIMIRQ